MARSNSIFSLKGSIDNVSFYNHKDYGPIVRKKGGPTQKQIETLPQFENTRGNITEFGYCSSLAKRIRAAFGAFCHEDGDSSLHGRIAGRVKMALNNDTEHKTGHRRLTSEGVRQLKDIPLRKNKNFDKNPVVRVVAQNDNSFDVHWLLDPIQIGSFSPPEATHVVITSCAASFSLDGNEYNTDQFKEAVFTLHNLTKLNGIFSHKAIPYTKGMIMLAMRIHFQMQNGDTLYDLNNKEHRKSGFVYIEYAEVV